MTYSIAFTSNPIIIQSSKKISDAILNYIQKLADIANSDFTHTVHNSSAYRFNEAPVGHTTIVTKDFIQFLGKVINFISTDEASTLLETIFKGSDFTLNDLSIDSSNNIIIKKKDVFIDSLAILTVIILEEIREYLKSQFKDSFSIEYATHFVTHGDTVAKWSYIEDDGILYEGFPPYPVISIFYNDKERSSEESSSQFSTPDRLLKPRYYIISAPTFKEIIHHHNAIKNLKLESEFLQYLWEHDVALSIVHEDKTLETLRI